MRRPSRLEKLGTVPKLSSPSSPLCLGTRASVGSVDQPPSYPLSTLYTRARSLTVSSQQDQSSSATLVDWKFPRPARAPLHDVGQCSDDAEDPQFGAPVASSGGSQKVLRHNRGTNNACLLSTAKETGALKTVLRYSHLFSIVSRPRPDFADAKPFDITNIG